MSRHPNTQTSPVLNCSPCPTYLCRNPINGCGQRTLSAVFSLLTTRVFSHEALHGSLFCRTCEYNKLLFFFRVSPLSLLVATHDGPTHKRIQYTTTRNEDQPSMSKTDSYLLLVVLVVETEFPLQGRFLVLEVFPPLPWVC